MKKYDVIVIGAGASGLLAAGKAASDGASVLVVEKNKIPGKKLLITGKGRCNITNNGSKKDFFKHIYPYPRFFNHAFGIFFNKDIIQLLSDNGLDTIVERGERVFPATEKAGDVVDTLFRWTRNNGVSFRFGTTFTDFVLVNNKITGIEVKTAAGVLKLDCRALVACTGGCSYPGTGSTGDVFPKLTQLGHITTPLLPALVPLETAGYRAKQLQGLSLKNIDASVWFNGKKQASEFGELLFTAHGLSGPVILTLSRIVVEALEDNKQVTVSIDLKPALDDHKLDKRLLRDLDEHGKKKMANIFRMWLPAKMIPVFLEIIGIDPDMEGHQLSAGERKKIRLLMKNFEFRVSKHRGFKEAIITAGGISCDELESKTTRSKLHSNLFLAGELLELYGNTGGYNLQIAFSTGWLAGLSAAEFVKKSDQ